jgi:hypothetical protein
MARTVSRLTSGPELKCNRSIAHLYADPAAAETLAGNDLRGQRALELALQLAAQRPGTIDGIPGHRRVESAE